MRVAVMKQYVYNVSFLSKIPPSPKMIWGNFFIIQNTWIFTILKVKYYLYGNLGRE